MNLRRNYLKMVNKISITMPEQDPKERVKNFNEVALGYTEEMAINEAKRCLKCKKKPCVEGCPVSIDIPSFIQAIAERNFEKAIDIIHDKNSLPLVTGRVCPQEEQCQKFCALLRVGEAVSIGRLERFVADWEFEKKTKEGTKSINLSHSNGVKVAIIGSGPAGLTCAGDLCKFGYDVTIFEAFHKGGGVLVYGIPEFRLPKIIVQAEIDSLINQGVHLATNNLIGSGITVSELFDEGFKAIFIGTGAGLPQFMGINGENLAGIYSANEFLTRVNLMKAYLFPDFDTPVKRGKNVAVIGGGNVAMDSARTALRLGAEHVYLIYRRGREEMPAREEEIIRAEEEGIDFNLLTNPVKYLGDDKGFVKEMECIRMKLGEPDSSGRRRPCPIEGSNFKIIVDQVVVAIGTTPNPVLIHSTPGLETKKRGEIITSENGETSIRGIYAGGDIVTGAATVITAMGAGRKAALAIDKFLKGVSSLFK
jgi:glutamate synthase (NADPH/NADH) small chain